MTQRDRHHLARKTPHASVNDYERQIDMAALRRYRLAGVGAQLIAHDYAGCLLYNPLNIRCVPILDLLSLEFRTFRHLTRP